MLTIGHSTRPLADFLALLRENGVGLLVDVRRFPSSRRHPHFSGKALSASLEQAGIAYRHEPDLGGHRAPRPDSLNPGWRNEAFRGYADHMATPTFQAALERLLAGMSPVALMCAEALPSQCHRQIIADALVARGVPVSHVLGPERTEPHRLTPGAEVRDGGRTVIYVERPGAQARLFR